MSNQGALKWKFDVSAFRLIGRDLITDRVTALFELLKNCYDANASEVWVSFENISSSDYSERRIKISDNGYGMSFEDVRDKWMVIGTSSKRKAKYSPAPFYRRCVGEKGIGRFAVDKLGDIVTIQTKKHGDESWLQVTMDWNKYEEISLNEGTNYFTDVENEYKFIFAENAESSGTTISIFNVREQWTEKDVLRFLRESCRIVSPYSKEYGSFEIHVIAPEFSIDDNTERGINQGETDLATLSGVIGFGSDYQEEFFFDEQTVTLQKKRTPLRSFGGVDMRLYFFDGNARAKYKKNYPHSNHIDGIKIYRDGLITTPFAEMEEEVGNQRDILGIDKNRWQDMFDKISAREVIGFVDISKERNPEIIDSTNRQDFTDTLEYRELKSFILRQLSPIVDYKRYIREKNKGQLSNKLVSVGNNLNEFAQMLSNIGDNHPEVKFEVQPLMEKAQRLGRTITSTLKQQEIVEAEYVRKENMYLSIMSLQEYAIQVTHAVRTSLSRIQTDAQYFYEFFPDPEDNDLFLIYAKEIYDEMQVLDKVIDYMLSYSSSNLQFEELDTKAIVQEIVKGYLLKFKKEDIEIRLDLIENLHIFCNLQFIKEILQNLINNSIKALQQTSNKQIKITSFVENDSLVLLVSDNGSGIARDKWDWVFGLYNTTTEKDGGAGVGLYVVQSRVKALKGKVYVTESEYSPEGTTIKIELPFRKSK